MGNLVEYPSIENAKLEYLQLDMNLALLYEIYKGNEKLASVVSFTYSVLLWLHKLLFRVSYTRWCTCIAAEKMSSQKANIS